MNDTRIDEFMIGSLILRHIIRLILDLNTKAMESYLRDMCTNSDGAEERRI